MARRLTPSTRRRSRKTKREAAKARPGNILSASPNAAVAAAFKAGNPTPPEAAVARTSEVAPAAPAEIATRPAESLAHTAVDQAALRGSPPVTPTEPLPARMLNEFVYCPRLFYYEFVEGVFVHNADTTRGAAIHARVDSGSGAMPPAETGESDPNEPEVIHSRSVSLGAQIGSE
jgi:hypothetical protein